MGLSSSTSTVKPSAFAQPYITAAGQADQSAYNANSGNIQNYTNDVTSMTPWLLNNYKQGNPSLNAQQNYITSTLAGGYQPTADFQKLTDYSDNQVANQTAGMMGLHGQTGGSDFANIISRNVGLNDANLRQNDYNNFLQRQQAAAGMAPANAAANYEGINPVLSTLQASLTPIQAASGYSGSIAGLMSPYTSTTQNNGLLNSLIGAAGYIGGQAIMHSDERLKENIKPLGRTDAGLPIFTYNYRGDPKLQVGVMAQDVAREQPEALGPVIGGYMTVDYGKVR